MLKSVMPAVQGQAPVAIAVQLGGVMVGKGTMAFFAQTPLSMSFPKAGNFPSLQYLYSLGAIGASSPKTMIFFGLLFIFRFLFQKIGPNVPFLAFTTSQGLAIL
jgi:hypothetical protein